MRVCKVFQDTHTPPLPPKPNGTEPDRLRLAWRSKQAQTSHQEVFYSGDIAVTSRITTLEPANHKARNSLPVSGLIGRDGEI